MARQDKGFSLIEIIIAIIIMATGLVALAGLLVVGVTLPQRARQQEVAKQLANEIMESIIFAKESSPSGFNTFNAINYGINHPEGRFVSSTSNLNITKMLTTGPDRVYGTCDDGRPGNSFLDCAGTPTGSLGTDLLTTTIDPGKDGDYSTTTGTGLVNKTQPLLNYSRQIIITDLTPPPVSAKEVEVRVFYQTPLGTQEKVVLICRFTNFKTL
jgi:prepilin-type N-terminal cleavage/methylation domain-containing protein